MSEKDTQLVKPNSNGLATTTPRTGETASTAMAAQAKAMVEARYIVAQQRPRNMDMVRTRLTDECKRPSFAEVAIYNKPIGKGVEGPSIRFAEAAMRAMGNIFPETLVTFDDDERRVLQVSVTDLESNFTVSKSVVVIKTIERRQPVEGRKVISQRKNSYDKWIYVIQAIDDEILDKQNALESKAMRGCMLRIIPGDLVDECMALCRRVKADASAKDPDAHRKRIADNFNALGIKPTDLGEYLGHDLAQSTPAEIDELRSIFTTLRDGECAWPDALAFKREQRGEESPKKKGKAAKESTGVAAIKAKMTKPEPEQDAEVAEESDAVCPKCQTPGCTSCS